MEGVRVSLDDGKVERRHRTKLVWKGNGSEAGRGGAESQQNDRHGNVLGSSRFAITCTCLHFPAHDSQFGF
jgi:hypothetical protein